MDGFLRTWVAQRLRGKPVLAEFAVKIASQHTKGQYIAAGQKVIERFLFDWIDLHTGNIAVGRHQCALLIKPQSAYPSFAGFDQAAVRACLAAHALLFFRLGKPGRLCHCIKKIAWFHWWLHIDYSPQLNDCNWIYSVLNLKIW